jgi:serine/threonine protein kinase
VLEYLPGGNLFSKIRTHSYLSHDLVVFYSAQILLALQKLHSLNLVYRDLKPENVMIDHMGYVKLIDFGFSKKLEDIYSEKTYTNCGTPGYCAPEVMMNVGHSWKADIWGFGIILCEMIGGHPPFDKETVDSPRKIMEKCRNGQLNLPKNIGLNSRDLVKQLLHEDPELRLDHQQIKQHKFYEGVDWAKLEARQVAVP